MARQFQALGLTTGEGVDRLTQAQIAQTNIGQRLQSGHNFGLINKKIQGLADGKIENIVDVFSLIGDLQYGFCKTAPLTIRAGNEHIRQKLHFNLFETIAFAGFTPSAVDVKGKIARPKIFGAGVFGGGQQFADGVKGFGVGQRIGTRRTSDGALIDQHHIVDVVYTSELLVATGAVLGIAQCAFDGFVKDFLC